MASRASRDENGRFIYCRHELFYGDRPNPVRCDVPLTDEGEHWDGNPLHRNGTFTWDDEGNRLA